MGLFFVVPSSLQTSSNAFIAIPSWVLLSGKRGTHWKPAEGAQPPALAFISPKATAVTMAYKASYMPDTLTSGSLHWLFSLPVKISRQYVQDSVFTCFKSLFKCHHLSEAYFNYPI